MLRKVSKIVLVIALIAATVFGIVAYMQVAEYESYHDTMERIMDEHRRLVEREDIMGAEFKASQGEELYEALVEEKNPFAKRLEPFVESMHDINALLERIVEQNRGQNKE